PTVDCPLLCSWSDDPRALHSFPTRRSSDLLVRTFEPDGGGERVLLDLRGQVWHRNELGLLSVALDPDFEANGRLWVYYVPAEGADRKSTRLNSSHVKISYAVFCLKKKRNTI